MGEVKKKKQIALYFKKAAVAMLVTTLLLQTITGMFGSYSQIVKAAITTGDYINLELATTELYQGESWSGSNASVIKSGTKATITVNNFGTGNSNEWGIQYMVKNLGLKSNTKYQVDFDITSTVDKEVFIKLDDTGLIAESIYLKAGEKYHYSKESVPGTPSADKQILYFALGRKASEANDLNGTVTIESLSVVDLTGEETATDITVNKQGTNVVFQLAKNAATVTAKTFYTICNS